MKASKITQSLLAASVLATLLVVFRGGALSATGLGYLAWNLFLAWIPYVISVYCMRDAMRLRFAVPFFLLWLLFFPNAPYLVTDVVHVVTHAPHAVWYDSLIFFFFGWIGLLLGMVSLHFMRAHIRARASALVTELSVFGICLVASFGVYLGRFQRWNSWDIFLHPSGLLSHSYAASAAIGHNGTIGAFVAAFTFFMYSAYLTVRAVMSA